VRNTPAKVSKKAESIIIFGQKGMMRNIFEKKGDECLSYYEKKRNFAPW